MRKGSDVLRELSRSNLFEGLTAETLGPLAEAATSRELVRGEHLWRPDDPANELYVMASGETKSYLSGPDGTELVHLLHGPGMTFGEPGYFSIERMRAVANVATMPSVVIRLDRRDLDPFMRRNSSTLLRALEGLAGIARWYGGRVMALELRPLRDRILLWLLDLVESPETGDGKAVTAAISQTTLAAMTGVSRENVNRALAELMADGTLVVTADGDVVDADDALLWGLRGGGGNFGIVSRFEFDVHPVSTIFGGLLLFPFERAAEVMRAFRDWAADAPDEAALMSSFMTAPPAPFVPPELTGQNLDAGAPAGPRWYFRGGFVADLTDEIIEVAVRHGAAQVSPMRPRTTCTRVWSEPRRPISPRSRWRVRT